jgi:branched-subunit amino acid transport protein
MSYSQAEIWLIIGLMAVGTFLIRFSFLGLIGDREMSPLVLKFLRYTPVAVLPGLVAPLAVWPAATDGQTDLTRLLAALAAIGFGYWFKNPLWGIIFGVITLYLGLFNTGQL